MLSIDKLKVQPCCCARRIKLPNDERVVRGCVKSHGQPVPLLAGQELFLDYGSKAAGETPCNCFSMYGFIPKEYKDD